MQEACELAYAIEGNSLFAVIAVGRFVMTDELTALAKQSLRWGVSVALLSDKSDRTVVFTEDQWQAYAKAATRSASQPPIEKSKCVTHSVTREQEQLLLF